MYKLNRRVGVKVWAATTDQYGGNAATLVRQYTKWAQVDNRRGGIDRGQGKDQWEYDTIIIMRHERTRPTKSNFTIDYEGCRYIINQVVIENEAHNKFDKCYCSMVDENIS